MWPLQIPKNKSILIFLWAVALAFLVSVVSIRSIFSTPLSVDSYTHIAIGQYILDHKNIPHHNDISFKKTDPSLEWISHSWISDTLLYMAQRPHLSFGLWVLVLPTLFLSVYLAGVLLSPAIKTSRGYIYLCIPIICALNFWRYHPYIFIVPLQLGLMILLTYRHRHPKSIVMVPIIFVLWANISGGTIFIPMLYLLVSVAMELMIHDRGEFKKHIHSITSLLLIVPISLIATILNPYGIRLWVYTLTTYAVLSQNKSFASLIGAIDTINQTYNKQQFSSLYLVLFAVYALILIISFVSIVLKKTASVPRGLQYMPSLFLLPFAFFWVRLIPLAAFATLPLFVWCMEEMLMRISNHARERLSLVTMTASILGVLWILARPPILAAPKIPTDHMSRIREFSLPANILTTYDLTGYSMYSLPEYKAMIDAQDDLLSDESLISFYQPIGNFSQSFGAISETLSVETALVSRDIGGLSSTLSLSDEWNLLYVDYDATLYVNKNSMEESFLQKNAMHTLELNTSLGYDPDHYASAAAELEIFAMRYPKNTLLLGQLATVYRINTEFDNAEKIFSRIPKKLWNFSLFTEYGRLKAAKGQCIGAEDNFLKALSFRNEKNYSRTVLDLAVLYAGCFKDFTRAKHYFTRYNSFLITTTEREKLNMLTKQFNIDITQ